MKTTSFVWTVLLAMILVLTVPYLLWRLGRTEYWAPLVVVQIVAGIVLGWLVYLKKRIEPFEPVVLARGWYYDAAISWFMGNPGREVAQGVADFDATVVDGAVTGVATVVRETATETRKAQTGYVRQYAAIIGVGVVLLLSWFVVIRGIL